MVIKNGGCVCVSVCDGCNVGTLDHADELVREAADYQETLQ